MRDRDLAVIARAVETTEAKMSGVTDYVQARDAFVEMAKWNQSLARGLLAAENPAQFAYDEGRKILLARKA